MAKNDFKATLPDGRVIEAQSDTELRKLIEKEYGSYRSNWTWTSNDNGFTYKVYTPLSDDRLYNDIFQSSLPEVVVTAKGTPKLEKPKPKPKAQTTTPEPRKSIIDVQLGRNASSRVDEASAQLGMNPLNWPRNAGLYAGGRNANYWNSDIHKAVKEGGDIAAIVAASPLIAYGAAEYAIPWAAENLLPYMSANGWLQATQATGTTPFWLTPTTATAIDATLAGSATGASIYDMYKHGPSVENVTGTALGLGGLAFEAAPTLMELYDSGRTAYNTYRLGRSMNSSLRTPSSKPSTLDFSTSPMHSRFRLGEVEIDDPFNNYRMLGPGGTDNFIRRGNQFAPSYKPTGKLGRFDFDMSNPMYARGTLWYGAEATDKYPGLLVTRQPMHVASSHSTPFPKLDEANLNTKWGTRRVPVDEGAQNLNNTGVYSWDPNYYGNGQGGYVRLRGDRPMMGLYERPKSKLTASERAGIPKGERAVNDPAVMDNAKKFALKYSYDEPATIDEAKDMYRRHNTFFRTVFDSFLEPVPGLPYTPTQTELYLQSLPREQRLLVLASKGYPTYHRGLGSEEGFSDPFVFVTPGNASLNVYVTDKYPAVMLRRPFSLRDPSKWHTNAEWSPISEYERTSFPKGTVQIGNSGPAHELKVSTLNLYPVRIATGDDVGTNGGLFFQNVFDKNNPLRLLLNDFFKTYKLE